MTSKGPQLRAWFGKPDRHNDPDIVADGDEQIPRSHKRLLIHRLCEASQWVDGTKMPSLVEELTRLGYDITTLRFSIRRKP